MITTAEGHIAILSGVAANLATMWAGWKNIRRKVHEIHALVNSRLTASHNRIAQLIQTLHEANIDIPDEPTEDET